MKNKHEMKKLLEHPKVKSWRTLMISYNKIYRYLESELSKNDFSISRFQIFFYLYFNGPLSAIELSELLNVTRGNTSSFIKRLDEKELIIQRLTGQKGGKKLISLSSKGTKVFESLLPKHIEKIISIMPVLEDKTLETLNNASN